MNEQEFAVDAALLRELGERLIGRPAIALGELVKNAYDADARRCLIEIRENAIVITDNGSGMSEHDFLAHWMRIGTTHKADAGLSPKYQRSFTGSKGVGRLSVQFLADEMTMQSTTEAGRGTSLFAMMDWRKAIRGTDLSTVKVLWETRSDAPEYADGAQHGTRIELKRLKGTWDAEALTALGQDVWRLRSPFQLFKRTSVVSGTDFEIDIEAPGIAGAREAFDKTMNALFSNWKARIRGQLNNGRTTKRANVTIEFKPGYPEGSEDTQTFRETVILPLSPSDAQESVPASSNHLGPSTEKPPAMRSLVDTCSFEILIFKPEGRQPGGVSVTDMREYLAEYGSVSVYDAGFRLPYYGGAAGQDWLSIAVDQGRRLDSSVLLPERLRNLNKYMQDLPAPGRIFGAVDIDTNHERVVAERTGNRPGECLQIQPGRDRLHDNYAFAQLRNLVRFSLDFYANRHRVLSLEAVEKTRDKEPASEKYERAIEILDSNEGSIPGPVYRDVRKELADAKRASRAEERALDSRASMLAPLAAAGMAALALNHELSRESRFLGRVGSQLHRIARKHSIAELRSIADEFDSAKGRLDSLQELFAPLLSDMDKAVTDRLRVRPVVQHAVDAMRVLMPGVKMDDLSGIPKDQRFPLGSLAEWNAVLQNVLSNAWNAMLAAKESRIGFRGATEGRGREFLRISDTGQGLGVPLEDAPKLFEPFERRLAIAPDTRSIALGGQGLGLTIVRMIARRRSAQVAFVDAEPGYSTTLEISWKG